MIPRAIHQLWKTAATPPRYRELSASWRRHHPGWEYRLWTDDDLHAFVAAHYPTFLPIYEGYRQPIKRVDAARYLILRTFGGLYVDLDFECFRSIEPLLEGCSLAIGLEPEAHLTTSMAMRRGMKRILCPSLLASEPGHPYWDVVLENLIYYHEVTEVLDATGPFLLTRCFDELPDQRTVRLLPARDVYPIGYQAVQDGELFDLRRWDDLTRSATALHHWDGNWVEAAPAPAEPQRLPRALREQPVKLVHPELCEPFTDERVSALMVTRDRSAKAKLAIDCFRRQTYPDRELVIVDDGSDDTLAHYVAELADPSVRMIRLPDRGDALGNLRNLAVEAATGAFVCQWDDDDLYHPFRIDAMMHHVRSTNAQAAFLTSWVMWWVAARRFAIGEHRLWEGSMICRTDRMPRYPRLGVGEDSPVALQVAQTTCFVGIDQPRLYVYAVHGTNTWYPGHFEQFWLRADRRYEGDDAERVYRELVRDVPLDDYPRT